MMSKLLETLQHVSAVECVTVVTENIDELAFLRDVYWASTEKLKKTLVFAETKQARSYKETRAEARDAIVRDVRAEDLAEDRYFDSQRSLRDAADYAVDRALDDLCAIHTACASSQQDQTDGKIERALNVVNDAVKASQAVHEVRA